MKKIYMPSSWNNTKQVVVVKALRDAGHMVYDFRNPVEGDNVFHWSAINPQWEGWAAHEYIKALQHPIAESGFKKDYQAMIWADVFVGVQPFGRSASLELGWACGQGKPNIVLLDNGKPELMVKLVNHFCTSIHDLLCVLREVQP